jgi:hypothetical protein
MRAGTGVLIVGAHALRATAYPAVELGRAAASGGRAVQTDNMGIQTDHMVIDLEKSLLADPLLLRTRILRDGKEGRDRGGKDNLSGICGALAVAKNRQCPCSSHRFPYFLSLAALSLKKA